MLFALRSVIYRCSYSLRAKLRWISELACFRRQTPPPKGFDPAAYDPLVPTFCLAHQMWWWSGEVPIGQASGNWPWRLPIPKALLPEFLRMSMLNRRAQNQTWRTLQPQLKGINCPSTAFLNRRAFVTGVQSSFNTEPWLKEDVQKPLVLLSHSLSPFGSRQASQGRVCAMPFAGHHVPMPGSSLASSLHGAPRLTPGSAWSY